MPHLELNRDGWVRLANMYPLHNLDDLADVTGIPAAELAPVFLGREYPDAKFVATCLASVPAAFSDLFVVRISTERAVA